jgi:hypothetical protein
MMNNPISDSDEVSERFVSPVRKILGGEYRTRIKFGDWLHLDFGGDPGFKRSSNPTIGFRVVRSK